jgi:hypothetical protein
MRSRNPFRRPIALVVSTALLSGGLALVAAPASAAPTVASLSPSAWDNRSEVTLTITGSGFSPKGELCADPSLPTCDYNTVIFKPVTKDLPNEVGDFSFPANLTTSTTSLTAKVNLSMAPAGAYKVVVADADGVESTPPAAANFSIYGFGPANVSSVAFGPNTGTQAGDARGARPLDVKGTNFSVGAKVQFLTGGVPDPGLTFAQGDPGIDENVLGSQGVDSVAGTGYVSATALHGNYSYLLNGDGTPQFTPGLHSLRVVNTDGITGGATVPFAQPYFAAATGVSPTTLGLGSSNVVVTVTGQGIRAGSTLQVQDLGTTSPACDDVSMGASTVSNPDGQGTYTTISAPVSVAGCTTALGARTLTINGPEGAAFTSGGISIQGAPAFTAIQGGFAVLGQGAKVGYGNDGVWSPAEGVTITGANFAGVGETDPTKMTRFDLGAGVTVTTRAVISAGSAEVTIDVASNAVVGERSATVTNPNGGSASVAPDQGTPLPGDEVIPFTVQAGPQVTKVTPPSFLPTQAGTVVALTGSFTSGRTYNLAISNATAPFVNYPTSAVASSATALSFSMSTNGATPGLRDLTVTDTTNNGRFVCTGCLGIDSLQVTKVDAASGSSAPNNATGTTTLTFASTDPTGLETVGAGSTVRLNRLVTLPGQPAILGAGLTGAGAGLATAAFDLRGAAPGQYSATIVLDPNAPTPTTWSCTGCVTVISAAITTTAIAPATGGQGATNRELTITGTNFAQGMVVSIEGVTVHDPLYVNATTFKVQVDIPSDAAAGAKAVTVTNGDGGTGNTGSTTTNLSFEVTTAPVLSSVAPTSAGQGAGYGPGQTVSVTLTGDDFSETAVPVFGAGVVVVSVTDRTPGDPGLPPLIPATQDTLTATIKIAESAATGLRAVSVDNGDGGTGTKSGAFTVNPGPKVTSVVDPQGQSVLKPDGVKRTIRFLGSSFATADPKTTLAITKPDGSADSGIAVANVVVVSAGEITADVTVAGGTPLGARTVAVTNAGDKGYGTCTTCVVLAVVPTAPTSAKLTPGASALAASWVAPAGSFGAPVTGYRLELLRSGTTTPTVVTTTALTYAFTGLVNGATYTLKVSAANAAGVGPAASASGVPGLIAKLSAAQSVRIVTFGNTVTYSGKMTYGSAGVPNKAIRLAFYPAAGKAFVQTVATSSTGFWRYTHKPAVPTASFSRTSPYNVKVYASFTGDSTYRQTVAAGLATYVSPKVVKSSPASGARSSASTTLKITGSVGPKKPGKVVYLYRITTKGKVLLARTTLSRYSTYTFAIKPGRGSYTLRVYIPTSYISGRVVNTSAYSPSFVIYRT